MVGYLSDDLRNIRTDAVVQLYGLHRKNDEFGSDQDPRVLSYPTDPPYRASCTPTATRSTRLRTPTSSVVALTAVRTMTDYYP